MFWIAVSAIFLTVSPANALDVKEDSCRECLSLSSVSQEGCAACAGQVRQIMVTSSFDNLTYLMGSLKKSSHDKCGENGFGSKACEVYKALCYDDKSCDSALLCQLAEYEVKTQSLDRKLVA